MRASSPTEVCGAAGARFFRVGRGPSVGRRGGIYPARGRLRRRGVRRDEGVPPYGCPESGSRSLWAGHIRKVCRGGPWPSRGTLRRRGVPGTMQASSPTEICGAAGARFPGWPRHSPSSVGVDSISARGCLRRRGVRRDEGIPPYGRPGGFAAVRFGGAFRKVCRGGIYPSRGPSGAAGFPGRCEHRPLQRFVVTGGRSFPVGRGIRRRP